MLPPTQKHQFGPPLKTEKTQDPHQHLAHENRTQKNSTGAGGAQSTHPWLLGRTARLNGVKNAAARGGPPSPGPGTRETVPLPCGSRPARQAMRCSRSRSPARHAMALQQLPNQACSDRRRNAPVSFFQCFLLAGSAYVDVVIGGDMHPAVQGRARSLYFTCTCITCIL
jgi:hypothetical protein